MRNILSKFSFHYTFLLMAFGLVITGHFVNLMVFTSIIIFHELGHIITTLCFKYKVEKVTIYPYGGLTKVNKRINTNINNDIIVAISGICFQTIYFLLVLFLYKNNIIREYIYNLFYQYNKSIIIFNILPVIPLDGSKIVNLLLSKCINYNLANKLTIIISLISILIFVFSNIFEKSYSIIMILIVLFNNIYNFYKELSYIYNRFLLERYLYDFNYKQFKIINNKDTMYKNKKHYFNINKKILSEKEYLKELFKKNQ